MALLCKKSFSVQRSVLRFPSTIIQSTVSCGRAGRTEDEVKSLFEEWAIKQGRVYDTLEEKEKRFQMFRGRLRDIEQHNFTGSPSWTEGLNKFSDRALLEVVGKWDYVPTSGETDDESIYYGTAGEETDDCSNNC